jgi:hypothetical protein
MPPISRRRLLAGTGLAVAGALTAAGIGSAVAAITGLPRRDDSNRSPATGSGPSGPAPAAELASALTRERQLLAQVADLIAATLPTDSAHSVLAVIRADHQAHAGAISALITESGARPAPAPTSSASSGSPTSPTPPGPTLAGHKSAEQAASDAAASDAARAHGAAAVLLASIAACEAGHAELIA